MIVIRNVFHLKFGTARAATALLKEGREIQNRVLADVEFSTRLLADVSGRFYTRVLELTIADLATYESQSPRLFAVSAWRANYQEFSALLESGPRDIFKLVE